MYDKDIYIICLFHSIAFFAGSAGLGASRQKAGQRHAEWQQLRGDALGNLSADRDFTLATSAPELLGLPAWFKGC